MKNHKCQHVTTLLVITSVLLLCVLAQSSPQLQSSCSEFGQCSQVCKSDNSGCSCITGFTIADNKKSCIPTVDPNLKIIFGGDKWIGVIERDENGTEYTEKIFPRETENSTYSDFSVRGVTYDVRRRLIFWTDDGSQTTPRYSGSRANRPPKIRPVYRTSLDSPTEPETMFSITVMNPNGIAFDWITGNLYFTDIGLKQIIACRTDVWNKCAVIVSQRHGLTRPMDVVLHPNLGIMFWTEDHDPAGIFRAGMDGSSVQPIITSDIKDPMGITVDQGGARIYWADWNFHRIDSANFDGSGRRVITASTNGVSLDILGDTLIWSDRSSPALIQSVNKLEGNSTLLVHRNDTSGRIFTVSIFNIANQPILVEDPCKNNTQCSHICVLSPRPNSPMGFHCRCPIGNLPSGSNPCMEYMSCDSSSCTSVQNIGKQSPGSDKLVISFENKLAITTINVDKAKLIFKRIQLPQISEIRGVVYNRLNHTLILTDFKKLFQYDLTTDQLTVLIEEGLSTVTAMDVDNVGGNLYLMDSEKNTVDVMSLKTRARIVLLSNVTNLCGIVVAPEQGALYLSRRSNPDGADVYNYTIDGTKLQSVAHYPNNQPCTTFYDDNQFENSTVQSNSTSDAPGMKVVKHGNTVFWVDSFSEELVQAKLSFLKADNVGVTSINFLWGEELLAGTVRNANAKLTVVSRSVPEGLGHVEDLCATKNCEHVCLNAGICLCSVGFTLQQDGKSCLPVKGKVGQENTSNSINAKPLQQETSSASVWTVLIVATLSVFVLGVAAYMVILKWRSGRPFTFENPVAYFQGLYRGDNMRIL